MSCNKYVVCLLVLALAGLGGCSKERSAQTQQTSIRKDKIQGKIQILLNETNATDIALSAGGSAAYLWTGGRRYRLFLKTPYEFEGGKEYIVEGIDAQKAIDEIGDPDQGRNGYPLESSCRRVVKTAWPGLPLDVTAGHVSVLSTRIKRYPARSVFLVTRVEPAAAGTEKEVKSDHEELPELTVPADKQIALLLEGPKVQPAPLWAPDGGNVRCKVQIDHEGKVSDVRTGQQLCEAVQWSQFRYKPTIQKGKAVNVETEVDVRFEPRKVTAAM